jgi:hypothetical protein
MIPDGKMFYFTSAAAIWQLLNVLLIYVTKTLKIKTNSMGDIFIVLLNLKGGKRNMERGGKDIKV